MNWHSFASFDPIANLFQSVIEASPSTFYHPAIWWLSACVCGRSATHCCDDLAVSLSGDRLLYARALASMETLRALPPLLPTNLAIGARSGQLLPRIRRLLGLSPAPRPMFTVSTAIVTLLLLAGLIYVGCSKEMAQSATLQNPSPSTAPAIAEATNNATAPGQAAFAAASNAEAESITIETRVVLVPEKFLGDIRIDWWDVKLSVAGPATACPGTASAPDAELQGKQLDNWTLGLIEEKLTADKSSSIQSYPPLLLANNASGTIPLTLLSKDKATNDPRPIKSLPITASLSQDREYVILGFPQASETHAGQAIHPFMVSCPDGVTLMLSRVAMDAENTPRHYLILIKPSIRAAATIPAVPVATAPSVGVDAARADDTLVRNDTDAVRENVDSAEHLIPYRDLMIYPDNWLEVTQQRTGTDNGQGSAANRVTRAKLEEPMKEITADNLGLEKVINHLHDSTGAVFDVNWKELATAGIKQDTPVTLDLRDIPLRKALTTILAEVGHGTANLAYTVDDGIIVISTRDDLTSAKYQVVRVYDIRDLIVVPGIIATDSPPFFKPDPSMPAIDKAKIDASRQAQ